jgi:23S rRNA (guanine745-N1)-methyltransferase
MVTLICPVRSCGAPLERRERALACERGHSFDVARSGYYNLLQPRDRRSKNPGDPREVVEARRRFLEAGHGEALVQALIEEAGAPAPRAVLDVGCGEGFYLGRIAGTREVEAHGTDLSAPAVDLAARRYPGISWVVANADRFLPYAPGSFDLLLSINARLNPEEMRRVLAPGGRLLVAVPAPDDLLELRAAVLGEGALKDRMEKAAGTLAGLFEMEDRRTVRQTARMGQDALRDALAATYRGGRESRMERLREIPELEVTLSHDLARFRVG